MRSVCDVCDPICGNSLTTQPQCPFFSEEERQTRSIRLATFLYGTILGFLIGAATMCAILKLGGIL